MKKFKFQLETLLKVTRMKKDDIEVQFAALNRKLLDQQQHLRMLLDEMQQGQRDYEGLVRDGTRVNVERLVNYNRFFAWKREQIEMQNEMILQTKNDRQKKLKELMEVMSYLKSIEQLKEKRFQEYKEQALFEEQKMLDEIGLQLAMRARREAAS